MIKLTEAGGRVVADDIQHALAAADSALVSSCQTNASVLEASQDANMHPRTKQKLLESFAASYSLILQGRRALVDGHSQAIVIQRKSNIAEVDFGCVGGPEDDKRSNFFTIGQDRSGAADEDTRRTTA